MRFADKNAESLLNIYQIWIGTVIRGCLSDAFQIWRLPQKLIYIVSLLETLEIFDDVSRHCCLHD